jgi:cation diffusion facilitator CzcD-associated flavoprotein CzcO
MSTIANDALTRSEPAALAADWIKAFGAAAEAADLDAVLALFADDCWWRDLLTMSWDLRTMHGQEEIAALAGERLAGTGFHDFALDGRLPANLENGAVTALFTFATKVGDGRALVRLREQDGSWKAWTLLTRLEDLTDHPEQRTVFADAHDRQKPAMGRRRESWYEIRERESSFLDSDPDVLVVGGGHAGLSSAARLQHMGFSTLLVERTPRIGDVWRDRYWNLGLHTVSFFVEMPYLSYPDNWPIFPHKDLIADWFEAYAWILRLNVWTSTRAVGATYDEDEGRWTVELDRDGEKRIVHPRHVVFASGAHAGDPSPPEVAGSESFRGEILHSTRHRGGEDLTGKKVVVVGASASAIDIAEDSWEGGAEVTLVQRSGTTYMSIDNGVRLLHGELYSEVGPGRDEADMISLSMPFNLLMGELAPQLFAVINELDAEMRKGLEDAGFELSLGPNGSGHLGASITGGGCYIDTGGAALIVDGSIKIQRGEIASFTEDGVVYSDGTEAAADLVIFATGFPNMRDTLRPIVGDEIADQLTVVWGLDEEGEINGLYRPSGHPRLWYMGGGFQDSRWGSKLLALQIKAAEEGLKGEVGQ